MPSELAKATLKAHERAVAAAIAAERERCAKIAEWFDNVENFTAAQVADRIRKVSAAISTEPEIDYGLELSSGAAHALYRIADRLGKIEAIAMVRWKSGMGLVESKNWVENFMEKFEARQPKQGAA